MKIDHELLKKIAHLSRLELNEKNVPSLLADMNAVVDWVEQLQEVNTEGVEPLTSMTQEINSLRNDEVTPPLGHDEALSKAPDADKDFFRVPRVMEEYPISNAQY
jgi:aspartyl-tRNA(Asn)/glutamyl-tRNA(Gln) amidotransferase subunit C